MARTRSTRFGINVGFRLLLVLMSTLGLIVTLAGCSSSGAATPGAAGTSGAGATGAGGPRLSFKETEHDFGPISHSTPMEYRFALTNTGDAPLQIGDIRAEPLDPTT